MRKSRTVGNDENGFNIDNVPITQEEVKLDREPEQPSEAAIDQAPQKSEQTPTGPVTFYTTRSGRASRPVEKMNI